LINELISLLVCSFVRPFVQRTRSSKYQADIEKTSSKYEASIKHIANVDQTSSWRVQLT